MSKTCIRCGATIDDNALFCDDCGAKQDIQTSSMEDINTGEIEGKAEKEAAQETSVQVMSDIYEVSKRQEPSISNDNTEVPLQGMQTGGESQPITRGQEPLKQSKMGIAALVMGVIAIVSLGSLIVFDILGIIFGIVGMRNKDSKTGFAKAGLILSVIATVIIVVVMAIAIIFGW